MLGLLRLALGKWCASENDERGIEDADDAEELMKKAERRTLKFHEPIFLEHYVPMLEDIPIATRRRMFWSHSDYASIRDKQRRLIELVLKQANEMPAGVVPPPIPGESRRGLGICCEPGTNSGRAARVRSARRAIVEAQRDGCTPEQLSELAAELSRWATKNAYDVGLKDHEAIGDFDLSSFVTTAHGPGHRSIFGGGAEAHAEPVAQHDDAGNGSAGVAHAVRRGASFEGEILAVESPAEPPELMQDGLGLASMIRNDSLSDLAAAAAKEAKEEAASVQRPREAGPGLVREPSLTKASSDPETRDGLGLASMIRNDSLGDLASMGGFSTS